MHLHDQMSGWLCHWKQAVLAQVVESLPTELHATTCLQSKKILQRTVLLVSFYVRVLLRLSFAIFRLGQVCGAASIVRGSPWREPEFVCSFR